MMFFKKEREAFSMITAIFLIVIMAALLALVSSLSGKVTKETTNQYRKEQAALLAQSYTEYAILAIQGHQLFNNTCLRTINALTNLNGTATQARINNGEGYRVEVKIQYIGLNNDPALINCPPTGPSATNHSSVGDQTVEAGIATNSYNLYATIDVYVMYHDMNLVEDRLTNGAAIDNNTIWRTYHKRTVQKL